MVEQLAMIRDDVVNLPCRVPNKRDNRNGEASKIIKIKWQHNLSAALNIPSLEDVSRGTMIEVRMGDAGNTAWKIATKTKEVSAN
ncbi:hypothetical protein OIU74_006195 [Salix koriyanagi]|uniref:Uncharacterized protein n=1 Tax=Salix koriyanagi TaxID=2511006 RepID=A0A9Q0UDL9_9ROSI|nr:hypothetical protein OIU74_006195 [Salix koriyanagi]